MSIETTGAEVQLGAAGRRTLLACLAALYCLGAAGSSGSAGEPARPGKGPGSYRILSGDRTIRFPFEYYRGDVAFQAEINGKKTRMLIDNGIMWDQILFFGSPLVDSLGLSYDGEIQVGGGGEGEPVMSRTASNISLRFPGVEFADQTGIVTPYVPGRPNPWGDAVGQVCGTFFKHFVVSFDFDAMLLTLTEPDRFHYEGMGSEVPMTPLPNGGWSIPGTLVLDDGRRVSMDLMMDLGLGDQFEISTKGEHAIPVPKKSLPSSLGFGIQGETRGRIGRLGSVEIGGHTMPDVIAGFVDENHTGPIMAEVMVGLGLLSRFNFVYDYPHHRMYLEPNRRFKKPFEDDMSGLEMSARGRSDYLKVSRVREGSPAEEAGIRPGDQVVRIDGRDAVEYDAWELKPVMQREGAVVSLTVRREGGGERTVSIKLRRLL